MYNSVCKNHVCTNICMYVCMCVIVMTHIKDTARDVNSLDMHTPTSVL